LEKVRELGCPVVRGNHDDDSSKLKTGRNTNHVAKAAQEWTFNKLTEEQRAWLQSLLYVRQVDNFTIVHASLDHPQQWHYVTNKFDAIASIAYQFTQLCFVGHSHVPQIYVRGESVEQHDRLDIIMEEGKKYLVNLGSVRQPRDGDWRASYCVYDTETGQIAIQRIE